MSALMSSTFSSPDREPDIIGCHDGFLLLAWRQLRVRGRGRMDLRIWVADVGEM